MKRYLPYLGPLVGLIGIALALYFHAQATQERVPTYYVSPQRAIVVDTTGPTPSELQVLHRGKSIGPSVIAAIVYIWNDGKLPIRPNDILEPVTIQLENPSEILEARLLKVSRPVIKFKTGQVNENAKNTLEVSFEILERSDGAAIQLIYAGSQKTLVTVTGTVVGAGTPRPLTQGFNRFSGLRQSLGSRRFDVGMPYLLLVMGIVMSAGVIYLWWITIQAQMRIRWKQILLLVMALAYVAGGTIEVRDVRRGFSPGVPPTIWI